MHFVALDIETANADMSSICQIGMARYVDGNLTEEWSSLIDPEDYFSPINISIHGISPNAVAGKPKLPEVADQISQFLGEVVCVCHTHFDRVALQKAYRKYNLRPISTVWLDSARVARRAWRELAWGGYGLASVCEKIGYRFEHHNALEDAKAAGQVLLAALRESGEGIEHWLRRVNQPIDPTRSSAGHLVSRDGNPDGDLFGEILVFTGALDIPRSEAADLAALVGCQVAQNVTKKTTILVVGDQDVSKLAGHEKSSKHRKAEQLISEGCQIRIIRESDFKSLVEDAESTKNEIIG